MVKMKMARIEMEEATKVSSYGLMGEAMFNYDVNGILNHKKNFNLEVSV